MSTQVTDTTKQSLKIAVQAANAKGATAPVALDVRGLFPLADVFLIVSGGVERNVQAIADAIEQELSLADVRTIRREGRGSGRWVLIDFGDLIVHIFHQEEREFYGLERLWKDCPAIDLVPVLEGPVDLPSNAESGVE